MATFARSFSYTFEMENDEPELFQCYNHSKELLEQLRDRVDLCDVVLIAGDTGRRISAHRVILMASSDYFCALLSEKLGESQQREITLNEVDGDALEKLVNYCYTGSLELRGDTIKILLTTANHLHLKKVVERCCDFLLRHLQPSNCLAIDFLVKRLNLEAYLHNIRMFICENFEEVSNHPDFLLLNSKQLSEFIARDDLRVPSEEFVFEVLLKWIEYEPENRRKHFTELLAQVRLPMLAPNFLAEKVELLCDKVETQNLVLNALKSHLRLTSNSTQPRNYQSECDMNQLLAIYTDNKDIKLAAYNLRINKWTTWNTPLSNHILWEVGFMDDNLIVVGAPRNCPFPFDTFSTLNLHTMVATKMPELQIARFFSSIAVFKGSIYVVGGLSNACLKSVERLDPVIGTWSSVAPMNNGRASAGVSVFNDHLYVTGGYFGGETLTSVECYDPIKNIWRSLAPMKMKRCEHCLVAHKGYLLAIGGGGGVTDMPIERYDPRTDTWTSISSSLTISGRTKCASLGPKLFIYNDGKLYMMKTEGSCDNLELQIVTPPIAQDHTQLELIAFPYTCSPPEKFIDKKGF